MGCQHFSDHTIVPAPCGATGILEVNINANERITSKIMTHGVEAKEKRPTSGDEAQQFCSRGHLSMNSSQNCCIILPAVIRYWRQYLQEFLKRSAATHTCFLPETAKGKFCETMKEQFADMASGVYERDCNSANGMVAAGTFRAFVNRQQAYNSQNNGARGIELGSSIPLAARAIWL